MIFPRIPFSKKVTALSVGCAFMALSLSAQAVDFGLSGGSFSITGNATTTSASVSSQGIIGDITGINKDNLGVPTFGITLQVPAGTADGSYAFQTYVMIDDNNTQRRLEASLGTFTLTVSSGTITGTFGSGQNLGFYGRNGVGTISVTGTVSNVLQNVVNLSGGSITFDAQNALDELVSASPSLWGEIDQEFTEGDAEYNYALVFKAASGVRIGNFASGSVTPYPCASTTDIDNLFVSNLAVTGPAYALQGQFATGAQTITGTDPTAFSASCTTSTGGGSTGGGTTEEPETTIEEVDDLISDADLTGDNVDAVNQIADDASAISDGLADDIASGDLTDDQAIGALTTLNKVVTATSTLSSESSSSSDSGIGVLTGLGTVLKALDNSANTRDENGNVNRELSTEQKAQVKNIINTAIVNAVTLLANNPSNTQKAAALQAMGSILSSAINLGVEVTDDETNAALSAADQTPQTGDPDTDLERSIPLTPQNKQLISRGALASTLAAAGIDEGEADILINQLSQSINPDSYTIRGRTGRQQFNASFSGVFNTQPCDPAVLICPDFIQSIQQSTGTFFVNPGATGSGAITGKVSTASRSIPARAISTNLVASSFPDGLRVRAGGGVVLTSNRVATVVVPASYDPIAFYTGLRGLGMVSSGANDGNITIVSDAFPFGFHFTGTFDYRGTIEGGDSQSDTSLDAPTAGEDESDLNHIYMVTYPDGTKQRLQPYVSEDDFIADLKARGIPVITNRNTGVVTVNGTNQFRPAYFVEQLNNTTQAYLEANADSFGIAFRQVDMNGDGLLDVQIISEIGAQTAYRLP